MKRKLLFFSCEKEPDEGYEPEFDTIWYDIKKNTVFVRNRFEWEVVLQNPECGVGGNVSSFYLDNVSKYYDDYMIRWEYSDGSSGSIGFFEKEHPYSIEKYVITTNNGAYVFEGYHEMIVSIRKDKDYELLIRGLINSNMADVFECSKNKFSSKKITQKLFEDLLVPYHNPKDRNY
jgi:hypothetical protein